MTKTSGGTGLLEISGTFAGQGIVCPQFRMDDGETISLSGAYPAQMKLGEKLTLSGRWAPESKCMQGREFRVFN